MLDVFGAKFFGMQVGSDATDTLLKLIGVVLVVWAVAAALRRLYRADADLIVQVLSLGFVILLAAYVLGTKNDENEIVGLLPLGAVLAGRVLTAPIIRNKLVPALAIVLVIYAGMLGSNALRPAHLGRGAEFAACLKAHDLVYGLGNFWNSTNTTVDSGGGVRVRPVRTFEDRIVTTLSESSGDVVRPAPALRQLRRLVPVVDVQRRVRGPALGPAELRAAGRHLHLPGLADPGLQQEPAGPAAHRQLVQRGLAVEHPEDAFAHGLPELAAGGLGPRWVRAGRPP